MPCVVVESLGHLDDGHVGVCVVRMESTEFPGGNRVPGRCWPYLIVISLYMRRDAVTKSKEPKGSVLECCIRELSANGDSWKATGNPYCCNPDSALEVLNLTSF